MFRSKRSNGTAVEVDKVDKGGTAGRMNRTGIARAPEMALDLIREARKTPPSSPGDARVLAEYRGPYIEAGESMGSRPEPVDSSSAGPMGPILLDKLGERLLFERQGVRLYEGLIGKAKLLGMVSGGPSLDDLEHILAEEKEHFRFLQRAVVESGGDPTALTPCANIAAVLSQGVVQVVTDPRSTLVQCLDALLVAELADNDGWTLLKQVARAAGAETLVERIEEAEEHEGEHLSMVRGWLSALIAGGREQKAVKAAAPPVRSRAQVRPAKAATAVRKPKPKPKAPGKSGSRRSGR